MQAGMVDLLCRQPGDGGALAAESVAVSAEHGFAFWHAMSSALSGWALVQEGHALEGNAAIERALTAMQATGTRLFSNYVYAFLAEGCLRAGTLADGLAAANAGVAISEATLDCGGAPELWRLKGELLAAQAKVKGSKSKARGAAQQMAATADQAEACFQRALDLARANQAKSLELRAATSLARAWLTRGCTADARKLLGGICKWFGARADGVDLREARALLAELATVR